MAPTSGSRNDTEGSLRIFHSLQYAALFFIGIANALPLPIMGSTLSIWLTEQGFEKDTIGLFALLAIPMSFKILWTPFIDRFTLPFFKGNERKGWVLFSLTGMTLSLLAISFINPAEFPWHLAGCIVILSIFTACLYMSGIAYELESLEVERYPMGSANVNTGYRIGLLCSGGGVLFLSSLWDWAITFQCIALLLVLGALLILFLPEPFKSKEILEKRKVQISQYPTPSSWFWNEMVAHPCKAFFRKPDWFLIFVLLLLFKVGDELSKCMEGPFYLSLGFTKADLAAAAKTWGMATTLLGAFTGVVFSRSKDLLITIIGLSCLHASTLFCYYAMAVMGKSMSALYITVALEHFTGGLLMTPFIAFLWKCCDKGYAPIQYALFWSIISFKTDLMACFGGFLATRVEWDTFFLIIAGIGITAALLPLPLLRRQTSMFTGLQYGGPQDQSVTGD